ncbi:hypothetical protein PI125_g451 [Phytophthora idaei]|nr:hypothetical protein PI125_g451 [Phytophthora idaei]KAG3165918.1 hypothetical protein PI126_g4417 [Phytophthora idaei]
MSSGKGFIGFEAFDGARSREEQNWELMAHMTAQAFPACVTIEIEEGCIDNGRPLEV